MKLHKEDTTDLIKNWSLGDKLSEEQLFTLTYQQFKTIAREVKQKINVDEPTNVTTHIIHSTTALVHDAYIKLVPGITESIDNRKQFYLLVSKVMRHILVDHHRKNNATKRQIKNKFVDKKESSESTIHDYLLMDKSIENLTKNFPRQAETIQLRYFHGLKNKEIAELHQISESLVDKDLKFSKQWMRIHA